MTWNRANFAVSGPCSFPECSNFITFISPLNLLVYIFKYIKYFVNFPKQNTFSTNINTGSVFLWSSDNNLLICYLHIHTCILSIKKNVHDAVLVLWTFLSHINVFLIYPGKYIVYHTSDVSAQWCYDRLVYKIFSINQISFKFGKIYLT